MFYQLYKNDLPITRPLSMKDILEKVIDHDELLSLKKEGYKLKGYDKVREANHD